MSRIRTIPSNDQAAYLVPDQSGRTKQCLAAARFSVLAVVGVLLSFPSSAALASTKKVTLDNGVTILLGSIPGATFVAVETLYRVGIYHDPKGMTQASQLLERLVSEGGTKSYPPGGAIKRITQFGKADAAALPVLTHFNYILPPDKLNLALKIEADRLSSLEITQEVIDASALKCYEEVDFVERVPQAGMFEHALMAIVQGWRDNAKTVFLRKGLETLSVSHLKTFREHYYRPDNLTLVIVGNFDESTTIADATRHFGAIPNANPVAPSVVAWDTVPQSHSISWDGRFPAVCLSFPPPSDPVDQVILTMWGALFMKDLGANFAIQTASPAVISTSPLWSVGPMPFFLYATARSASGLTKLRQLLEKAVQDAIRNPPTEEEASQLNMIAKLYGEQSIPNWDSIIKRGEMQARIMKSNAEEGIRKALTDVAHQWGVREASGVAAAARLMAKESPDAKRIHDVLKRYLASSQQRVTKLIPK